MAHMRGLIGVVFCLAAFAQPKAGESVVWRPLFDGKTLADWRETAFTGHGKAGVGTAPSCSAPALP